jgi:nucleoid-associated protein YgaU
MRRPKTVAAVLAGGTLVLGAGSAVAASLPSWPTRPAHTAAAPMSVAGTPGSRAVSATPAATQAPAPAAVPPSGAQSRAAAKPPLVSKAQVLPRAALKPGVRTSVTYVVKRGDTLSGIAGWFKLHGYGALYAANAKVIGANPNLIVPGEHITISNGVMTLSHSS